MLTSEESSRSGRETVTVHIDDDIYKEIKNVSENKGVQVKTLANSIFRLTMRRYKWLSEKYPDMELFKVLPDKLVVADLKKGLVELVGKEKKLFCKTDNDFSCEHVHYMLLRPETALIMDDVDRIIGKGYK